jgi:hypothetical protein
MRPGTELYPLERRARICRVSTGTIARGWLSAGLLVLGVAVAPVPVAAQQPQASSAVPSAAPTEADLRAAAQVHFRAGMQHFAAKHYRDAIREFELSAVQLPNAEVWFDIARAHEHLGEHGLAAESYRRYLRDRVDAPDAREVALKIDALSKRAEAERGAAAGQVSAPAALAIDANQPGARLMLDGRELGTAPIDRIIEVEPGRHRLSASLPGYLPFRAEVEVERGGLSAAYVDMRPATRYEETIAPRRFTWFAAGASAVSLLATGAFGVAALSNRDSGDLDSARRWARASDLALGSAITFAVAATILYFAEGRPGQREVAPTKRALALNR